MLRGSNRVGVTIESYGKFLCRVLAAILKMADISTILKHRIAPLMVTYHYVKFYVSIIIQETS
jgi:hypothetical protein